MKFFPLFCLLFVTHAFAKCEKLVHLYGTMDLEKKSWNTEDKKNSIDWCIPLTDKADNLHVSITLKKKKFETTVQKPLLTHWDERRSDGSITGGTVEAKSLMIRIPAPAWYKGATITVTDLDSKNIIASGVM